MENTQKVNENKRHFLNAGPAGDCPVTGKPNHNAPLWKNLGRCWNVYKCVDCGLEIEVDSSD